VNKGGNELFRSKMSVVMYIVISLAIIGLSAQLFTNFTGFLMSILLMIIIAFVVFMIFSYIARNRAGGSSGFQSSPESKKYREAVKRSQEKYGKPNVKVKKSQEQNKRQIKRKKRRRPSHLRVIEGKKGKDDQKDNRASF